MFSAPFHWKMYEHYVEKFHGDHMLKTNDLLTVLSNLTKLATSYLKQLFPSQSKQNRKFLLTITSFLSLLLIFTKTRWCAFISTGLPAELLTRRQLFNSLQVPCSFNYHDRKGLGLKVSQNGRCQSKKKDLALFIDVLSALFPRLFVAVMDTNVKISIPSWSYTPVKRMFPPDHPFFEVSFQRLLQ